VSALRVIHCPDIIGGHAPALAQAERSLGLASESVALAPHPFAYAADRVLSGGSRLGVEIARWRLLAMLLRRADIVHFNFGMSSMPQRVVFDAPWDERTPRWMRWIYNLYAGALELRDLAWLRQGGKRIVVTFQGDDARQGEALRRSYSTHPADEVLVYTPENDRLKSERIALFDRHADAIYALNPDLLRVLPARARFLPYAVPLADRRRPPSRASAQRPERCVLHAPSHRGAKGTSYVLSAVERLRSEGRSFRFILIEGVPHEQAVLRYAEADLVVDQLLYGWYGALAVEAMALGKPVIAYIRDSDLACVPAAMRETLPVIPADPRSIYEVLGHWLSVPWELLEEQGRRSRAFAERWHDPLAVARVTFEAYRRVCGASDALV
jgi:hypothetical protein